MNYTKGEWKVYPTNYFNDKGMSLKIANGQANEAIALIDASSRQFFAGNFEELKANAHLIAAAPIGDELATAILDSSFDDYDDWIAINEIAKRFKAKAEGKGGDRSKQKD